MDVTSRASSCFICNEGRMGGSRVQNTCIARDAVRLVLQKSWFRSPGGRMFWRAIWPLRGWGGAIPQRVFWNCREATPRGQDGTISSRGTDPCPRRRKRKLFAPEVHAKLQTYKVPRMKCGHGGVCAAGVVEGLDFWNCREAASRGQDGTISSRCTDPCPRRRKRKLFAPQVHVGAGVGRS